MINPHEVNPERLTLTQKDELLAFFKSQIERVHGAYVDLSNPRAYDNHLMVETNLEEMAKLMEESGLVGSLDDGRELTKKIGRDTHLSKSDIYESHPGIHFSATSFSLIDKIFKREPVFQIRTYYYVPNTTMYD